jgi:MFS transporter, DHA1 family, inner membrane transport protein
MAFFRNRAVNLLNLHYALHTMALAGGGAFFLVYLVKAGVSPAGALVSVALVLVGRFLVRPFLVALAVRFGLRALLVFGTALTALQYPLLAEVDGIGIMLVLLVAVSAISDTIYWTCYHAYFAAIGDDEHRGQQLGAREAIAALISVASPFVTGWLLAGVGPRMAFGVSGVVAVLAALPLYYAPDVPVKPTVPSVVRGARRSMVMFAADGWMTAVYVMVWQLALFKSLDESFLAYGGALAVAAMAAAFAGPLLGRLIDDGQGRKAVTYMGAVFVSVILARALATDNAALAVAANAAGAVVAALYLPTLMTAVYTDAKGSACPLRFHVATEGAWDVGGALGLIVSASLVHFGVPFWACVLLALAGIGLNVATLRGYYARA